MKTPTVSIGIPTYNRSGYLIRALESVLNQSYRNIEIIVSDNASDDDTTERVRGMSDPRIVFLQQKQNVGMTGNFNACLHAASGELFLLLSDDDFLDPACIERLSEPFRSDDTSSEEIGVSWCPVKILDAEGKMKYATASGPERESGVALVEGLFRGTHGPRLCSIMVRRKDSLAAGGFRPEHGPICDVGNWSQIAIGRPFAVCIPDSLAGYTVHTASITSEPKGVLWQRSGEKITSDLITLLEQRGDHTSARRIRSAGSDNTSNLLSTVMIQYMGKPGWVKYWIGEVLRAPQYLFAPVVFKRLFKDGWKLLRLQSRV